MPDAPPTSAVPSLDAARAYARYFIGSAGWADSIVRAYEDPEWGRRQVADSIAEHEQRLAEIKARNAERQEAKP